MIIPSVNPQEAGFNECIESVLKTGPAEINIVTVGSEKLAKTAAWAASLSPDIRVSAVDVPNKRAQVCSALKHVCSQFFSCI